MLNVGFSEQMIKDKFVAFGQGFASMSPALRDLESIILEKKLRHGDHPVLKMNASDCVVDRNPARKSEAFQKSAPVDALMEWSHSQWHLALRCCGRRCSSTSRRSSPRACTHIAAYERGPKSLLDHDRLFCLYASDRRGTWRPFAHRRKRLYCRGAVGTQLASVLAATK